MTNEKPEYLLEGYRGFLDDIDRISFLVNTLKRFYWESGIILKVDHDYHMFNSGKTKQYIEGVVSKLVLFEKEDKGGEVDFEDELQTINTKLKRVWEDYFLDIGTAMSIEGIAFYKRD